MTGPATIADTGAIKLARTHSVLTGLSAQIFLIALGYAVLGWVGQQLAPPPGFASLIWPASGLAIAGVSAWGYRVWPGVFLGALAINALSVSSVLLPLNALVLLNAVAIAAGSTLQALLAGYWIRSRAGFPVKLAGPVDALRLVVLVAPLACLVNSSIGTATLYGTGVIPPDNIARFWLRWWAGDMGGVLIVLPLLFLAPWSRGAIVWRGKVLSPFTTLAFVAILVLLCATLAAWRLNMHAAYERSQTSFEALATDSQQALEFRMQSYRQALDGGAALFEASNEVNFDEWRTYTSVLDLAQNLPGISGIGFIEPVAAGQEEQFVASVLKRGQPDFDIHPLTERDEKFVIVAVEPQEGNVEAIGLDIAFEANRRQAALHARDTGLATITQRILLVQDETESPGFLLLRPVYRAGMPIDTLEQRREAFDGWIYAPFIAPRFMNGLTASQGELFDITVYGGPTADPDTVIFTSLDASAAERSSAFVVTRTFPVMEQTWTVAWSSTPAFEQGVVTSEAELVLAGGLLLTLIFAALLLSASRREAYISGQVEEQTRELEETVAALADSERRFGDLAGLSPAGIFRTDPYGFCNYVNESWLKSTGLDPWEALGAGWLDAVHPETRSRVREQWLDAIGEASQLRTEVQFVKGDGEPRWVDLIAAPQLDVNGQVQGFIGVAIDISEQKRAADALKESEQRFQSLASFSPAGIFRTTPSGLCNYVNPAWCRMTDLTEDEAMGMGWRNAVHPLDVDRLTSEWLAALEAGDIYRNEIRWLHRDGSIVWGDAIARPELSEDGKPLGYIGVVLDITDRKRFEDEIAERDQELSLLVQNATDAVLRIGLDNRCIYASPSANDVLGVPAQELIGRSLLERLHPDDAREVAAIFAQLRFGETEKAVIAFRSDTRGAFGDYRWLEATVGLVRDAQTNAPKEISASVRDISDRKKMELDLVAARRNAETAAAAKATFLANMSHEIRTPMNGVIGFTELLLEDNLTPEQHEKAQLIADSGRAMMQILNDILDISKIDAGRMKIVPEPIDLRHKLKSCINLLEPSARQKGLMFELIVDEEVPNRIMVDPLRLRQILTNLAGNAIKFTSEGAVRSRVSVEQRPGGRDVLCISVEDSGIGIPANRLEAIFREFSQADDSTARIFGGTGLGLTISNELAKMMGGELEVSSEEGHGSVFTLRIPLRPIDESQVEAQVAQPIERELTFARPLRILVAEDHDINQALVMSMASRIGLAVDIAVNGKEAVRMVQDAKAAGQPYDMVLMDVQMPVMDGLEATRSLRNAGFTAEELPILAQTANAYSEDVQRCLEAGMQGHLSKPIRLRGLKSAIQRWLPKELFRETAASAPCKQETSPDPAKALTKRYAARRKTTFAALDRLDPANPLDRREVEAVAQMLHKLAGAAGMFGEEELGELARAQEKAILAADAQDAREAVRMAQRAFSKWK
ncbi:PAS domain S-box protein [Aurantiacibacter suaedae]|uniref:PAS domain S-box protein n=1 Tax=Aurantiacibacter suaedae TaxID=2545755 RepID=UPI0010F94F4C|nr:PAS domain S-box protein [Aurantiacibacter suaedae]